MRCSSLKDVLLFTNLPAAGAGKTGIATADAASDVCRVALLHKVCRAFLWGIAYEVLGLHTAGQAQWVEAANSRPLATLCKRLPSILYALIGCMGESQANQ